MSTPVLGDGFALQVPGAPASGAKSRRRHLHEYRQVIVALYPVPAAVAPSARNADPLDPLWRGLGRTYGRARMPGPYSRMHSRAAAREQRQAPMRWNRT